jgi:two-component sensor histidine kinase
MVIKLQGFLRIASIQLRMNADIALALVGAGAALGALSLIDFPSFERAVDIYCIGCCFVVYSFAVNTARINQDPTVVFLAPSFFFIALIDMAYALSRDGRPGESLRSLQLWASSGWFSASAFFLLGIAAERPLSKKASYAIYAGIGALVALAYALGIAPPRAGTPEYMAFAAINGLSVGALYVAAILRIKRVIPDGRYRRRLMASCALSFVAFPLMLAHPLLGSTGIFMAQFARTAAYYLVYKAIVAHALMKPYRRMFGAMERESARRGALNAELRSALEEKTVLLKEVHHRVKNNLQIISSLLNLEARRSDDPGLAELFRPSQERVRSMALVHEMLYESESLAEIDLGDYARRLLDSLRDSLPGYPRIEAEVESLNLRLELTLPLGLALNEMLTNAAKYGQAGAPEPRIRLRIRSKPRDRGGSQVTVEVEDEGPGLPAHMDPEKTTSLGISLIRNLAAQLGGNVRWIAPDRTGEGRGLLVRLCFPVTHQDRTAL